MTVDYLENFGLSTEPSKVHEFHPLSVFHLIQRVSAPGDMFEPLVELELVISVVPTLVFVEFSHSRV